MVYSVLNFNQEKIMQENLPLALVDLFLLDYIWQAQAVPKDHFYSKQDKLSYVWINHSEILEDFPVLNVGLDTISRKLKGLEKLALIKSKQMSITGVPGSRTFYAVTELCVSLRQNNIRVPGKKSDELPGKKSDSINTTNINSYNKELIKDTNSIKEPIKDIKNNKGSSVQKGKKELFKTKDSVQEIVDYYQQNCPDLPAIKTVSEQRKQAVKKILQKYGPDTVKEVLDKAQASKFLTGKSNSGRTWKCYFSWIFKEENFIKIWEGNYDEDFTSKKKDVFSEHGKVKSIPIDKQKKQKYLEELRKNGEQTDY